MTSQSHTRRRRIRVLSLLASVTLLQLIPFSCGQDILRVVTPFLLNDTTNILDFVVTAVAPLVLP